MTEYRRRAWLVLRAQSGDRNALDRLLAAVQHRLHACIRGITADDALAEDVLQDAMVTICRKLELLEDPVAFDAWAYRIATRTALRAVRRGRKRSDRETADIDATSAAVEPPDVPDPFLIRLLETAMATVPPASRAVLTLHYLEGLTLTECADILGIAIGTVKSRLAYGLAVLRREMDSRHE